MTTHHKSTKRYVEEPMMSDKTILVSVEDLISMAMGPSDKNIVNYKMVQTVLHILARQLRMLEQQVELHDDMVLEPMTTVKMTKEEKAALKAEKRDGKQSLKPGAPGYKDKDAEKADRAASKERDKGERAEAKERERQEKASGKDRDKVDREADKQKARDEKEKDKAEHATSKEREKAEKEKLKSEKERAAGKESDKVDKERDKAERATAKEAEKMGKAADKEAKEQEKADKAASKEREKADKGEKGKDEAARLKKLSSPVSGVSSIEITETKKGKDKVLVVEKGTTKGTDTGRRVGSIEVVTRSQFDLLKGAVKELEAQTAPLPHPKMPDNKKLRSDLARGSASLTDTMQAMQVSARVSAAEEAISRMADLLTQLAATGVLPEDVASRVVIGLHEAMIAAAEGARMRDATAATDGRSIGTSHTQKTDVRTAEIRQSLTPRKSVAIEAGSLKPGASRPSNAPRPSVSTAASKPSASRPSVTSATGLGVPCVSHKEMDDSLQGLRVELSKNMQNMTARATGNADIAANVARVVADKLDIALKLDNRISSLYSLTTDYAEQLNGFDAGLTTQMQSFQEQMAQMRADMQGGLAVLENANNNAETAAVLELTERYGGLVSELERTAHAHQSLTTFQKQLGDELKSLVECVEMLQEQKADRDEVLDGLKDKADISRLAGLLRDEDFMATRADLETRLDLCYDKFRKQDSVWLGALRELSQVTETKAELLQLMSLRDNTQQQLNEMDARLYQLADKLGEPKAAILTRKLARDALCGVCMGTALMDPQERSYGAPAALPPARLPPRPAPLAQEGPCLADWTADGDDLKSHTCRRWVGGSHTLMQGGVTRERAAPAPGLPAVPTRRYAGVGLDGQLYLMEEELQPCAECNQLLYEQAAEPGAQPEGAEAGPAPPPPAPGPETGAGDQGPRISQVNVEDEK